MSNNRIIYAAEAVFVGPSPATGAQPSGSILQIHRVQSVGYDYTRSLEDVQQFGLFAPIDRIEQALPTVSMTTSYLATNVHNESGIGLNVNGTTTALANILNDTQKEKNYFIRLVPDGNSAVGYTAFDGGVIGIGNGVLSSYSAQGQVGGFPTAEFSIAALDCSWSLTSSAFDSPAIDPLDGTPINENVTLPFATTGVTGAGTHASVIRPGNITVDIDGAGFGVSGLCIQSYNLQMDFSLEPIVCLGSKFPTSREPTFPINSQLTVEANMRDIGTGRLSNLQCGDQKYDLSVTLRDNTCDGSDGEIKVWYSLKNATLESQSFQSSIGPSKSVTLNFSSPIGGPQETDRGLFISGARQ